jgi:cardiolipin synthase
MKTAIEKPASGQPGERFWNVPNVLTLVRFVLVPVFALMFLQGKALSALVVFLAAGLTDVLDGLAARTWHQRTRVGTILDPLADKLLLSTAFILLTFVEAGFSTTLPVWLTAVVLARDVIIVSGSLAIHALTGRKEFPPSAFGKMSTVFQVGTVFLVIFSNYVKASSLSDVSGLAAAASPPVLSALFVVTLVLTVVSGVNYVLRGVRMTFSPDRGGDRGDQAPV